MSDREKKLVLFFGLAAFVLVNLFGVTRFRTYRDKVRQDLAAAQKSIETAESRRAAYDERADELEWMASHRPEPKTKQNVPPELEKYAMDQAKVAQLTVKGEKILETVESGYFHRARVEFTVSGSEASFYRWLETLRMPEQFRTVSFMRLQPDQKDDTLIDAQITVEQYFIPESEEAAEEEAPPSE